MLLYDRLLEQAERYRRDHPTPEAFGEVNAAILRDLLECQVYEITDLLPLFPDWEREKDKKVPRRSPHNRVWCEWQFREEFEDKWALWKLGTLISRMDADDIEKLKLAEFRVAGAINFSDLDIAGKELYFVQYFRHLLDINVEADKQAINTIAADVGAMVWTMNPAGDGIRCVKLYPRAAIDKASSKADVQEACKLFCYFGLGADLNRRLDIHNQIYYPWPPFLAFSLLHCKNIVTEDHHPEEKIQRHCQKHRWPPRVTYKTLKIQVPVKVMKGSAGADCDDDGPQVRFHLCSGHFKDLRHERYRRPGLYWWSSHYRGARELGEVRTTHRLVAREGQP
jgi:hypothetical protein